MQTEIVSDGSIRLIWFVPEIEGVPLSFHLSATDLNDSQIGTVTISRIMQQNYVFSVIPSVCHVYAFQLIAENYLGTSAPSEIITRTIPFLPDMSIVDMTLQDFLLKTPKEFKISVSYNVSTKNGTTSIATSLF